MLSLSRMPAAALMALTLATPAAQALTVNSTALTGLGNGTSIESATPGFGSSGPVTLNWDPLVGPTALLFWNGSYSGQDAAYCNAVIGCALDMVVGSGFTVTLANFSLGGWPDSDRNITWSVIDLANSVVVAGTVGAFVSGSSGLLNTINATSTTGFRILFGPDGYNGGLTAVNYTSAPISAIPLPAGGLLLLGALGGLALIRRRSA